MDLCIDTLYFISFIFFYFSVSGHIDVSGGLHFHIIESRPPPTARQDLVKLKVLLDCSYLCADSVTAVTTAAACQGPSPRIPPLITVFIGN